MLHSIARVGVAALTATALTAMFAPAANAAVEETVADGLITPLSLAVSEDGTVYASQNFAGMLSKAVPGGEQSVIYTDGAQREVGAVSVTGTDVTFATTGGTRRNPTADLYRLADGAEAPTHVADLYAYEEANNPDGGRTYGLKARKSCIKKQPKQIRRAIRPYKGIVESHPYATALGEGVTYLADAAGNSILAIEDDGTVSTVATLPATKVKVNRKIKRAFGLHKCARGKILRVEGVPTDVEIGPDGNLYVTSLPGGPEDPAFGANGSVYRFDPATGARAKLAGGLVSPVGIAISPTGDAYISMLFASTILKVPFGGSPETFAEVPLPGDVEFSNGFVYATQTDLMNDGSQAPAGKVLRWDTAPE